MVLHIKTLLTISFLSTRSSASEENINLTLLPTLPPCQILVCQNKTKQETVFKQTGHHMKTEKRIKKQTKSSACLHKYGTGQPSSEIP